MKHWLTVNLPAVLITVLSLFLGGLATGGLVLGILSQSKLNNEVVRNAALIARVDRTGVLACRRVNRSDQILANLIAAAIALLSDPHYPGLSPAQRKLLLGQYQRALVALAPRVCR